METMQHSDAIDPIAAQLRLPLPAFITMRSGFFAALFFL
jgi:hypothetical protein